jgi:CheY-like chemotaxis protein
LEGQFFLPDSAFMNRKAPILLVEDDADIAEAISTCLADHGFTVVVAANGREALDTLLQSAPLPSLILLDLMMPVMDGWQFRAAQSAEPLLSGIPVVLLSAHVNVREAAEKMAVAGWLKKPVELTALLEAVERPYD